MEDGLKSKVQSRRSKVEGLSTYVIEAEGRICLNSGLRLNPNLNYEQSVQLIDGLWSKQSCTSPIRGILIPSEPLALDNFRCLRLHPGSGLANALRYPGFLAWLAS